ncbi:hypothetical protein [Paenibacillus oryzisoli]|uniref:Rhodanese domain-containing protein n=1 Tax=Paenibacillus oryzisoli TaxID=1850517 RepID=A0A197ZWJ8_9BACL|nr:hypothetical protein [Paenibacillus oryzisoli]OAS13380.1 hypothetical protein A8708_16130 [Paenibacillus oryzisoli]
MNQLQGMDAAQLARRVLNQAPTFILDVRNETDYADWKIEGRQLWRTVLKRSRKRAETLVKL